MSRAKRRGPDSDNDTSKCVKLESTLSAFDLNTHVIRTIFFHGILPELYLEDLAACVCVNKDWLKLVIDYLGSQITWINEYWPKSHGRFTDKSLLCFSNCTQLREIDLGNCEYITDQGLQYLSRCTQLRKINVEQCGSITNQGLQYLSRCTKLEYIRLLLFHGITDEGLKLRRIDLTSRKQLNVKVRRYIRDNVRIDVT